MKKVLSKGLIALAPKKEFSFILKMSSCAVAPVSDMSEMSVEVVKVVQKAPKGSLFDTAVKSSIACTKKATAASAKLKFELRKAQDFMTFMVLADHVKKADLGVKTLAKPRTFDRSLEFETSWKNLLQTPFRLVQSTSKVPARVRPWRSPFEPLTPLIPSFKRDVATNVVDTSKRIVNRRAIVPNAHLGSLVVAGTLTFMILLLAPLKTEVFMPEWLKNMLPWQRELYFLIQALLLVGISYCIFTHGIFVMIRTLFFVWTNLAWVADFLFEGFKATPSLLATVVAGGTIKGTDIFARVFATMFDETFVARALGKFWNYAFKDSLHIGVCGIAMLAYNCLDILTQPRKIFAALPQRPQEHVQEELTGIMKRAMLWGHILQIYGEHDNVMSYGALSTRFTPGQILRSYVGNFIRHASFAPIEAGVALTALGLSIFALTRKRKPCKTVRGAVARTALGLLGSWISLIVLLLSLAYISIFSGFVVQDDDLYDEKIEFRGGAGITEAEQLIRNSLPYRYTPIVRNVLLVLKALHLSMKAYRKSVKVYRFAEKAYRESSEKEQAICKSTAGAALTSAVLYALIKSFYLIKQTTKS